MTEQQKVNTLTSLIWEKQVGLQDPDEIDFQLKMCKTIMAMDPQVQDRFKALKVLMDQVDDLDEEEDKEYRVLELKYEQLFKDIYEQRRKIICGAEGAQDAHISEFDGRAQDLNDEEFKKLEVMPCDVKDFQNTPLGVHGFWFKAMLNHKNIGATIQEKDRPILMLLQDISCELHQEGFGFDLVFRFEQNDHFGNEELRKSFIMTKQNVIEKCSGTDILWKEGRDVTKKKIKKKSKNKKGPKTQTKTVDCESFFNFFKSYEMPTEEKLKGDKDNEKGDEDEEEKDIGEKMDMDYDLGNDFKDQIIPLALEYYMEVIDEESDDEEGEDEDKDSDESGEDEDKKPEPKKKGKKKCEKGCKKDHDKGNDKGGAGGQQECKQQ